MTNPSLLKKTAARTAAVQCLYRNSIDSDALTPSEQVERLKKQLANNKEEQKLQVGMEVEPNYALVEQLLSGVAENRDEIDLRLSGTLKAEWSRERTSPLLLGVLQCAIYELFFGKEISPKIVIDEYSRISRSFFGEAEVNFVHAALQTLTKQYG